MKHVMTKVNCSEILIMQTTVFLMNGYYVKKVARSLKQFNFC